MKVIKVKPHTRIVSLKNAIERQQKTDALWDYVCQRELEKALQKEFGRE